MTAYSDRLGDHRLDPAQRLRTLVKSFRLVEKQDDEFVAPQSRHRVRRANAIDHPLRDRLQQFVADIMAKVVVDDLEIVEIDEDDRRAAVLSFTGQDGLRKPVAQQRAVGQTRQRIVSRHEMQAVFGELALDGDARDSRGDVDVPRLHRRRLARGP